MDQVSVPRKELEFAIEWLRDGACDADDYEPECRACQARLIADSLQARLQDSAGEKP